MRADHKAVLALLEAFQIDGKEWSKVSIEAEIGRATTVRLERLVFTAADLPEIEHRAFFVTEIEP